MHNSTIGAEGHADTLKNGAEPNVTSPGQLAPSITERLISLSESERGYGDGIARLLAGNHFPVDLVGVVRRLMNLQDAMQVRCDGVEYASTDPRLAKWPEYIAYIVDNAVQLANALGLNESERNSFLNSDGKDPLHGRLLNHGMAMFWWATCPYDMGSEKCVKYLVLSGQMASAHLSIMDYEYDLARMQGEERPSKEVFKSIYSPCNYARKFAVKPAVDSDEWSRALAKLPDIADRHAYLKLLNTGRSEYAKVTEKLKIVRPEADLDQRTSIWEALTSIAGFIGRGLDPANYTKKTCDRPAEQPDGNNDERLTSTMTTISIATGPSVASTTLEVVQCWTGTKEQEDELIEAGEDPAESMLSDEFVFAESETAAQWAQRAIESNNQIQPLDYGQVLPSEYIELTQAIRDRGNIVGSKGDALELRAWCDVLLWRGIKPDEATSILAAGCTTPLPSHDVALRFYPLTIGVTDFKAVWTLKALQPSYRTEENRIPGRGRSSKSSFQVADSGPAGQSVMAWLVHSFGSKEKVLDELERAPQIIFRHKTGWYRDRLKKLQEKVNGIGRITPEMLSRTLFRRMVDATEDVVSAALATRTDTNLASVRLSYTAVQVEHVRRAEQKAITYFADELRSAGWNGQLADMRSLPADHSTIGCRGCPPVEEVRDAVEALISVILSTPVLSTEKDRRAHFVLRHNAITLYCSWLISLSVGLRGVVNPFLHRFQYDRPSRLGTINEKYIQRGRNTRFFRLIQLCADQLDEFWKYHQALADAGLPPITKREPCYFLEVEDDRISTVTVRPKTIGSKFGKFFPYKPNFFRSLGRSEMLESGSVPPAYLDAWCGHACKGEEPLNPFSSFDPLDYFDVMEKALEELAGRLGFQFLPLDPNPLLRGRA
jgi:hypothetical protein